MFYDILTSLGAVPPAQHAVRTLTASVVVGIRSLHEAAGVLAAVHVHRHVAVAGVAVIAAAVVDVTVAAASVGRRCSWCR